MLEPRLQVTAALLHRAFYPQGLSCTCFTNSDTPTHTVANSPSPGAYAALSLITPW